MGKSTIEWLADDSGAAGATWNPVRGCTRKSRGCENCYAEMMAARFSGPGLPFEGYAKMTPSGPRWTGKVALQPEKLREPLSWKNPKRIFVCSMSDLFHERLPFPDIDQVLEVMTQCPKHTFLVLTKRADRMAEYFSAAARAAALAANPNIQVGVSAEDQYQFDERYAHLKTIRAAVKFISAEPLIGPIVIPQQASIEWLIAGGESGLEPGAMDPGWCRSLLAQCREQGIPFFMKQMGTVWAAQQSAPPNKKGRGKGGDIEEWPEDLRVREYPVPKPVDAA